MSRYTFPTVEEPEPVAPNEVVLVASGDLRLSANRECWPAQKEMEDRIRAAFEGEGRHVLRGHPYDPELGHGFIWSQRMGMDVFKGIPRGAPVVVAEAVWQYSHHVLAGLRGHGGPILTVANWSGQWPGLVGMLNLNASLTKAGVPYSTIWSEGFDDDFFLGGIRQWLEEGRITTAMDTAGGRIMAHRSHVDVELLCKGRSIGFRDVEVAVVDMRTMPVLIGRHPVFTTFDVLFQERRGVFSLSGTR